MGEGECETLLQEQPKKHRHRKKHLYSTILQQMEFYFSDSNLTKDRFLSKLVAENPYVDLEIFLKFNKIHKLNCTIEDIQKAIQKSEIIELSEDRKTIRRKKPIRVKENVDLCTIYVENIKADATHECLKQIFSDFGQVVYVSIPKYKHNKANKGFAFVEYETEEEANKAILFFDSIGCKISSEKNPEELQSIATFEGDDTNKIGINNEISEETKCEPNEEIVVEMEATNDVPLETPKKRKMHASEEQPEVKKIKTEDEKLYVENQAESLEEFDNKRKKKNKKEKKKNFIKELGMQVLSKKEWKKLRNCYLELQRRKMKEFKQYLNRQKFSQKNLNRKKNNVEEKEIKKETTVIEESSDESKKLSYSPGVIVKLKLPEPCIDVKKLKNDIKSISSEVKYVDIPLPSGTEEVFVRFSTSTAAENFCKTDFVGEKLVLENTEEKLYWEKIENDRTVKFQKLAKKQRGREKLLKRAERESEKHLRFDDTE